MEVVLALLAISSVGLLLKPTVGHLAIGMLFLMGTIALSLRVGAGPLLVAGIGGSVIWDYLFIPPLHNFTIGGADDRLLFCLDVGAALITGQLIARIREQERHERAQKDRAEALLMLNSALATPPTESGGLMAGLQFIQEKLGLRAQLWLCAEGEKLRPLLSLDGLPPDPVEKLFAQDALQLRRKSLRVVSTPALAEVCYRPLCETSHAFGVLALTRPLELKLTPQQDQLADDFAHQLLSFCARESLRIAREREQGLMQSEKLARSLLECASHELNTPLTVIDANTQLLAGATSGVSAEVVAEMRGACRRLRQSVENLLDQARLESGVVKPRFDWYDIQDVVRLAVAGVQESLGAHPLTIDLPADLPPFWIDSTLMLHVLTNLLQNTIRHTPDGAAITINGGVDEKAGRVYLCVADQGPGIPAELQGQLFKKFQRGRRAGPGGLGLGLSIVRGFVSAQGGEVAVENHPAGGAIFRISFPLNVPPEEPIDE